MTEQEEYDDLAKIVNNLSVRLMEALCEKKDFNTQIKKFKEKEILNTLFLLVKQEKFECAVIVRDEIISRGVDTTKISEYEKNNIIVEKYLSINNK